jgi:hypothetical protein
VTEELAKGIDAAWRLAADTAVGSVRQELMSASLGASEGPAAANHPLRLLLGGLPAWIDGCTAIVGQCISPHPHNSSCFPAPTHSAGSVLGGASGGSLLVQALADSLAALPRLSDERDQEQVEGISRLARALQVRAEGHTCKSGQLRLVCRALLEYECLGL